MNTGRLEGLDPRIPGPRWTNTCESLFDDPIAFVEAAKREYGDLVAVTEGWSVFSRSQECTGCVAAFGARNNKRVLSDPTTFGTQVPLADRLALPEKLRILGSSLFNMSGEKHRQRRQWFAPLFNRQATRGYHAEIAEACRHFLESWTSERIIDPLTEMRSLSGVMLSCILLGSTEVEPGGIGDLTRDLLEHRRGALSSLEWPQRLEARASLIETGDQLDTALRERIRFFRRARESRPSCLLARLCALGDGGESALSEDEILAHTSVFFRAGTEPVAVGLAWTLILLSQAPAVREDLARQLGRKPAGAPDRDTVESLQPLDWTVKESLRLLPPNAFMARVTQCSAELAGLRLPTGCEVLLSPYVSHRDPECFPRPYAFDPRRWKNAHPTPFEYLPYGAGPKHCIGSHLATWMMKTALAAIVRNHDISLAGDQEVNWKISVTFMPADGLAMRVSPRGSGSPRSGGRATGALRRLVEIG